jgi:hypothetical protein
LKEEDDQPSIDDDMIPEQCKSGYRDCQYYDDGDASPQNNNCDQDIFDNIGLVSKRIKNLSHKGQSKDEEVYVEDSSFGEENAND